MGKSAAVPEEKTSEATGFWGRALSYVGNAAIGVTQYAAETVGYMVQIVPASLSFMKAAWHGKQTPQTLTRMKDIIVWDILPYLSAFSALSFLERYLESHIKSEKLPETLQTRILLMQSVLLSMQILQIVLTVRQKSRLVPRVLVTNLTAPGRFLEDAPPTGREVCQHPFSEKLLGAVHGMSGYFATEFLLTLLESVCTQQTIALRALWLLRAYNDGDMITLPLLQGCQNDKDRFLLDNAPLVLAQGVVYRYILMDALCGGWIAHGLGLQSSKVQGMLGGLLLNLQTGIAAHMKLPHAPEQRKRWPIAHPFYALRKVSDVGTDILIQGGKKVLPGVLQNDESIIPWGSLYSGWLTVWSEERVHIILGMLIWSGLHRKNAFLDDPVLGKEWESMRSSVLNILTIALSVYDEHQKAIAAAKRLPKPTARIVAAKFGLNSRLVLALIQLLSRPGVIDFLRQMQQQLIKAQQAPRIQEAFSGMSDARYAATPILPTGIMVDNPEAPQVLNLAQSDDSVVPVSFFRQEASNDVAELTLDTSDSDGSSESLRSIVFD